MSFKNYYGNRCLGLPPRLPVAKLRPRKEGKMHPDIGKRVRLIHTNDRYTKLKAGDEGIIVSVDGMETRHIKWDNGSNLGLIPGVDKWEVIERR